MKSLDERERVVESICAEGCQFVNQLLVSTEIQAEHVQLQQLDKADKQWVLVELSSIMQVYEN